MNSLICRQMFRLGRVSADFALRASIDFGYTRALWTGFSDEVQTCAFALADAGGEAEQELALARLADLSRRVTLATGDCQLEEVIRRLTLVAA